MRVGPAIYQDSCTCRLFFFFSVTQSRPVLDILFAKSNGLTAHRVFESVYWCPDLIDFV